MQTIIDEIGKAKLDLCDTFVALKKSGFSIVKVGDDELLADCERAIQWVVKDRLHDYSISFETLEVSAAIKRAGSEVAARVYFNHDN